MTLPTWWPVLAKRKLQEGLEEYLIDNVDDDDPSKASEVVIGRFLDNKKQAGIVVEIHENDPDSPSTPWSHSVAMLNRNEDNPMYNDVIGKPRNVWLRRFVLKIDIFLRGNNTEEADDVKGAILNRVEQWLLDNPRFDNVRDDGGEYAINSHIVQENGHLSGNDRTPIWRHKVWIEVQTRRRR